MRGAFVVADNSMLKGEFPPIRSFAAEYLTFVSATGDGGVEVTYADENIWLSQKKIALLYGVEVAT